MNRTSLWTLLATFLFSQQLFAQVDQDLRVEIAVNMKSDDYFAVPVSKYGLVVFGETDEISNKEMQWDFAFYNTAFKEEGRTTLKINSRFYYKENYFDGKKLYVFFSSSKDDEFTIVIADAETKKVSSKTGLVPKKFYMDRFKVYKNYLYLAGNVKKDQFLCSYDLNTMTMTPFPILYEGTNDVKDIGVDEKDDEVSIVISNVEQRYGVLYLLGFRDGKKVGETKLTPKDGYNLLNGKVSQINKTTKIVIGTYAIGKGSASGMYFCKVVSGKQEKVAYYNFTDFSNFFNYLPEKRQEKIEKKIEKADAKGKELDFSYLLLVHELIPRGENEYVLIAEAYYATYRTETYYTTSTSSTGATTTVAHTRQVFDGWLYTHAVVAGFNIDGVKLWDNTFEMGDFKTFTLKERVVPKVNGDAIDLVYGYGTDLRTKSIVDNKVVDKKKYSDIETQNAADKVKRSSVSNVEFWYDNYFIASGYQVIKDDNKKKRKVFYFNSVEF